MKLSPAGWLYNAGVVGFLRIIKWGEDDEDLPLDILRNGLEPRHLERFALYYWAYAARHFLYYEVDSYKLDEKRGKQYKSLFKTKELHKKSFREILDRLAKDMEDLRVPELLRDLRISMLQLEIPQHTDDMAEDYRKFVNEIQSILTRWYEKLKSQAGERIEENERWRESFQMLEILIRNLVSDIENFRFQTGKLKRYYFNKGHVGNYSGVGPERLQKFHETYVEPALGVLNLDEHAHSDETYACTFCGRKYPYDKNWKDYIAFTEGDFAPIGVSPDKFMNFFYNGEVPLKCPVCQLILLSSYAGFNRKPFILQDLEGTDHIFINLPDLSDAFRVNEQFEALLRDLSEGIIHERDNLYYAGIRIILTSLKKKSEWVLNNVLFVEFKPTPRKDQGKPSFVYFNIDRGAAQVFKELGEKDGKRLENLLKALNRTYEWHNQRIYLSTEVLKRVLEKKSLKPLIFAYFKDFINGKHGNIAGLWAMVLFEHLFNQTRKALQEGKKEEVMDINKRLWALRRAGERAFSLSEIDPDKRRRLAQRFITLIRGGRKEEFYTELLRLYLVYKKENLAREIFSLLSEDDHLTFQEKALAWLTGFVSPTYGEREEEGETKSDKQEVAK